MKKVAVRLTISLGLIGLLLWILPWEELRAAVARLDFRIWAEVLLGVIAAHLAGVVKWRMILDAARAPLALRQALSCYFAGLFAVLSLPTLGGDALRAFLAARTTRRGGAVVLGGAADRLLDITGLAILMLLGLALSHGSWAGSTDTILAVLGFVAVAIAVGGLALVMRIPLSRWPPRLRKAGRESMVAVRRMRRRPGVVVLALVISCSVQAAFVLLQAWIGRRLGIQVTVGVWFIAFPLAKLASFVPVSLGGLGVRDATLAAILVPAGVPYSLGFMASLVWQSQLVAVGLLGGLIWLLLREKAEPTRLAQAAVRKRVPRAQEHV
jgi:uncharacterized membrane protein YbhN (UPF0104 family)